MEQKRKNSKVLFSKLKNAVAKSEVAALEEMRYITQFDALTRIYNKDAFFEKTQKMLNVYPKQKYALIRMDINRFSLINSFYGMKEGDEILKFFAKKIHELSKKDSHGVCGRIGADEFVFCITYETDEQIEDILKNIIAEGKSYPLDFDIVLSFGVYKIEDISMPVFKMLDCAKLAAKSIKGNYVHNYAFYDVSMEKSLLNEQEITNEMNAALKREEFCVYVQPKYDITTSKPAGAEALVRWNHPEKGMISPGAFIPVFEKNGFISKLDYYMWEHVCQILHRWNEEGKNATPISVNISRISMFDPHIVERIEGLVEKYEIPVELLNLEITESAYMSDPKLMKEIIERLRAKGFILLMDDFGSGYSSLNTLKDIDVDILKIDMKFLPTGTNNTKSEKILASVTRMAGWIGMPVVVEGVETKAQLEFLQEIGCGYVQGYYFAKPMPIEEYEKLVDMKEENQEVLLKNHEDILDYIWSSNPEILSLMKGITVPFAIYEYKQSSMELLRANEVFRTEFRYSSYKQGMEKKYFSHDQWMNLLCSCDEAVQKGNIAECDCNCIFPNGEIKSYCIRIQYVCSTSSGSILCTTFIDISAEKELEGVVNKIFNMISLPKVQKNQMLIVDDSEMSREILASMFEKDFEILTACDGEEALEVVRKNVKNISVILLDIVMPKMGGVEFLQIKNQTPEMSTIPVIIISAEKSEKLQIKMLKNGVNDYVTKPYVPEVVVRRVNNVLEYNSRFQAMLREYNESNILKITDREYAGEVYTIQEIQGLMHYMGKIFDVVRVVIPETTAVLTIHEDGTFETEPYTCFEVWGKGQRCENCTSICAQNQKCQITKYEFIKNNIFYVISRPIKIIDKTGKEIECVLEIVSHISDHILSSDSKLGNTIRNLLDLTQRKIYTDPLTEVYNRRYWNEMRFLYHGNNEVAKKIGIVMLDLSHFKFVNDTYGHLEGDRILSEVATKLKDQVRMQDSVIRYGGDEFVVVITESSVEGVIRAIERFRKAITEVKYGAQKEFHVEAAIGYSYTEDFEPTTANLKEMLKSADSKMYEEKK